MVDNYTRVVLTIIAGALVVIALRGIGNPIPVAHAADMDCDISGSVEITGFRQPLEIKVVDFRDQLELGWSSSQTGASSSQPIYVQTVNR